MQERHRHSVTELSQYKAQLQHHLNDKRLAERLTSLAEHYPGFWP